MKLEDIDKIKEATEADVNKHLTDGFKLVKIVKISNGDGGEHVAYVLGKQKI